MERTQFTFYESFYKAVARIKKKSDQAEAYSAIARLALYGEEPNIDALPDAVAAVLEVIIPHIRSANKKAESGKAGGESKTQANAKQNGSKREARANAKQEKEQEKEQEKDKEQMLITRVSAASVSFDKFWQAYPKKVGKEAARKSFAKVKAPVSTLIAAVEKQKQSAQWLKDNGQYIPNPATWLNQGRWEDETETDVRSAQFMASPDLDFVKQSLEKWRADE